MASSLHSEHLLDAGPKPRQHKRWLTLSQVVASIGNFGIQYNFGSLGIAISIMTASRGTLIPKDNTDPALVPDYPEPTWAKNALLGLVFAGAVVGMISMGRVGDLLGRRWGMIFTLALVTIGALCSALITWGSVDTLYAMLALSRFILGMGVGGIYPMAAATAHEGAANDEDAESLVGWASWWQAPGAMFPYIVAILLLQIPPSESTSSVQFRILMGLGGVVAAVPMLASLFGAADDSPSKHGSGSGIGADGRDGNGDYPDSESDSGYGYGLESSVRNPRSAVTSAGGQGSRVMYSALTAAADNGPYDSAIGSVEPDVASGDVGDVSNIWQARYWMTFIGTGGSWFFYDISYYGIAIFQPSILSSIFGSDETLTALCWQNIVVSAMGLPAAALGTWLVKPKGARWLNVWGFVLLVASFGALAITYNASPSGQQYLKFALFCMVVFALNTGPAIGTYVLPASAYPRQVRGTFHGLSSAGGKLGAVVGTFLFTPISNAFGIAAVLWVQVALSLAGALVSIFCIPDLRRGKSGGGPVARSAVALQ